MRSEDQRAGFFIRKKRILTSNGRQPSLNIVVASLSALLLLVNLQLVLNLAVASPPIDMSKNRKSRSIRIYQVSGLQYQVYPKLGLGSDISSLSVAGSNPSTSWCARRSNTALAGQLYSTYPYSQPEHMLSKLAKQLIQHWMRINSRNTHRWFLNVFFGHCVSNQRAEG